MKRIRFILNPKAGRGLNSTIAGSIKKSFNNNEYETEIIFTERAGHATELSRQAVENRFDIVVAAGGDGTINETAQSLKHSNTALAIIPTGSGNGFARHFNIPANINKAIGIIKKGKTIVIDSLLINNKFCMNMAGTGFDAHIAQLFANYGKRGFSSYIKLVTKEYFSYKEKKYIIEFDNEKIHRSAFLIAVANASQFGNGAKIAPRAFADDGQMDITILKKIPLHKLVFVISNLFNGKLGSSAYAELLRSTSFTITSEEALFTHIDGEPAEDSKKITATIDPLSIELIVP
ncbi:MAG: diacylglycerol kinase family protein [Bacteroidia bacterium]